MGLLVLLFTTATAAVSPLEALYVRLGVPLGSNRMELVQRRVAQTWKDQSVFADAPALDRRAALLEAALGSDAARILMLRAPLVLASDLEWALEPRLAALRELLPGVDISTLVVRAPAVLELDLQTMLEPRVRQLEAMLPNGVDVARTVRRAPTLLHLPDLEQRLAALGALLPGVSSSQLVSRAPSLLAYAPEAVVRKLDELAELFGSAANAAAMVKREPALLTYDVRHTLAAKVRVFETWLPNLGQLHASAHHDALSSPQVRVFETWLPNLDATKLLVAAPRLLSYDVATMLPRKLAALADALPGADIPRLIKSVPQLLEYDVETRLPPKLTALRALFHPRAIGPPPPPPSAARRLATSKLLGGRQPGRNPTGRTAATGARRPVTAAAAAAAAAAATAARGGRGGANARGPSTIGLLRLAALDTATVERRLERLSALLPEVDTIALVGKQPALLRRDVEGSLRPRLVFLSAMLGDPAEATRIVVANPRLLMSSWGVLSRLPFVLRAVPGGLETISVSSALMAPKPKFAERFPGYAGWLRRQIAHQQAEALGTALGGRAAGKSSSAPSRAGAVPSVGAVPSAGASVSAVPSVSDVPSAGASVAQLEERLGEWLERRLEAEDARGGELSLESFANDGPAGVAEGGLQELDARTLGLR